MWWIALGALLIIGVAVVLALSLADGRTRATATATLLAGADSSDEEFCIAVGASSPTESDLAIRVRRAIANYAGVPATRIHAETPFSRILATQFDGGDFFEIAMLLEADHDIHIPDQERQTDGFSTLHQLVAYLNQPRQNT